MTLFMRLLHYPGRQNIKYYGEPKPLVSSYLWQFVPAAEQNYNQRTLSRPENRDKPTISIVHPFISLSRHQMTHLWHFVVQKSSQQPLRCVSDYLCVQCSLCCQAQVLVQVRCFSGRPQSTGDYKKHFSQPTAQSSKLESHSEFIWAWH